MEVNNLINEYHTILEEILERRMNADLAIIYGTSLGKMAGLIALRKLMLNNDVELPDEIIMLMNEYMNNLRIL